MTTFTCHDCGARIPEGAELWLAADGAPDDAGGDPYHEGCAAPVGLAA